MSITETRNNAASISVEYLSARCEAMEKRIAELEKENDTLRNTMNLPLPFSEIREAIEQLKTSQILNWGIHTSTEKQTYIGNSKGSTKL